MVEFTNLGLELHGISCPYCGEWFEVDIDCSIETQNYIEDCSVCCQAIDFSVSVNQNSSADSETFPRVQVIVKRLED